MTPDSAAEPTLSDLERCFSGAIPAIIATRSGDGVPNVTYLSRVHVVDEERVALSNQFLSKTTRNLAEHPRANLLLVDPTTHDEYRLDIAYERTERRGRVFDRLREDVDAIASLHGMEGVFRLRAADIYRVISIERIPANQRADGTSGEALRPAAPAAARAGDLDALAELSARLGRSGDLDTVVSVAVDGIARLLGYEHAWLALLGEDGERLFTIASHGYEDEGVGSEVVLGDGVVGMAALRAEPVRLGNLQQMGKYGRSVRRSFEASGDVGPGREVPLPGLPDADSCLAVPALALGQLVGVLVVESPQPAAFTAADEAVLRTAASLVAAAVEAVRAEERVTGPRTTPAPALASSPDRTVLVRFFPVDGSTFFDGDYLIKGVAGRILWSLLCQHQREGRVDFTNREVRLDPSLELPAFRDNLEGRLIMLKRRLEEREAPVRIVKTGRGRFRLDVGTSLRLEAAT